MVTYKPQYIEWQFGSLALKKAHEEYRETPEGREGIISRMLVNLAIYPEIRESCPDLTRENLENLSSNWLVSVSKEVAKLILELEKKNEEFRRKSGSAIMQVAANDEKYKEKKVA